MDRERCLEIFEAYGVGPKLLRLLTHFWDEADMVCRVGGCYGKPFKAHWRVTQGGPFSPCIFNVMADAILSARYWICGHPGVHTNAYIIQFWRQVRTRVWREPMVLAPSASLLA